MNRTDRIRLGEQYARRRVRDGLPIAQAVALAGDHYGLSASARAAIARALRLEFRRQGSRPTREE